MASYQGYRITFTQAQFYVLAALCHKEMTAYALTQEIFGLSSGAVSPARGTVGHILNEFTKRSLLVSVHHGQNKTYTISNQGKRTLKLETDRLERAVRIAKTNLLLQ